jgi:hypothetical protein
MEKISDMTPPDTSIVVLGIDPTGALPVHDRFLILGSRGLKPGSSLSGYGVSRISGITNLTTDDCVNWKKKLLGYIENRIRTFGDKRLRRTQITLF